jgi:hypothetical protein
VHQRVLLAIGADEVVNPEQEAAQNVVHRILTPSGTQALPLAAGLAVVRLPAAPGMAGRTVSVGSRAPRSPSSTGGRGSRRGPCSSWRAGRPTSPPSRARARRRSERRSPRTARTLLHRPGGSRPVGRVGRARRPGACTGRQDRYR